MAKITNDIYIFLPTLRLGESCTPNVSVLTKGVLIFWFIALCVFVIFVPVLLF